MNAAVDPAAKPRYRFSGLRGLRPFLTPYHRVIAAALLALLAAALSTLAMPVAVRHVVDSGLSAAHSASVNRYFLGLFALAVATACFAALRFYLVSWLGERVVADLRSAVFRHVLGLSPSFFEVTKSGELLSRLTTDTTLIQNVVGSSLSIALRSSLTLFGAVVMLSITSPRLTGIILLVIPLVVVPIILAGRRVRALSRASQDRLADTSALAGEVLNAMPLVQAYTLEQLHGARYDASVQGAFDAARRRIRQRALLTAYAITMVFGALVLVLWIGAQDVVSGRMSGGELGQFLLYAVFAGGSTAGLSEIFGALQQAAGATDRLVELLAVQPDHPLPAVPDTLPLPSRGELRFEGVGFSYPSRPTPPALTDFNLNLERGQTIALVGPSGAGKSSVLALALAFYRPQQGRILLDGVDIARVAPRELRQRIAIVAQDTVLFADTIMENIRYGRPDASDEEVRAAARAAAAADFIDKLPQGYATEVGEHGVRLSGGQQQRISIARAVLKQPAILLLDEATSALDAESELLVQEALRALMRDRATLVIAHRLATVRSADRIVVLDAGRIVASGTHADLSEEGGLYARLAELQFKDGATTDPALPA
ncbi:MAG: ATP-binding cassette domain-containing protein [Proteobacteria bacterium]|nr:ATP-binding cassette domain-containing protein [Pseudomonadota bacterium]